MKTFFYKKAINRYMCAKFEDTGGEDVTFFFEEPIEAKLVICDCVISIKNGVGKTKVSNLSDGEITPRLYVDREVIALEGLIKEGAFIMLPSPDGSYIRELEFAYRDIMKRLCFLEEAITEIKDKITQKINF